MSMSRKGFLQGMGCGIAGATMGAVGHRLLATPPEPPPMPKGPPEPPRGEDSYAQCGEDRIVDFLLGYLGVHSFGYLDVGAYHPTEINNTYLFYRKGRRGVLIEPNVDMCRKLKHARPEDTVLEAGIGVTSAREADYYVMSAPSWNTFSKEEADHQVAVSKGSITIKEVRKMPLLDINQVIADHFPEGLGFLSVDTQGLELAILKTIDYERFRPKVVCAETLITGTRTMSPEIGTFMATKGYVVRGMSFVNTIFVDSKII